MLATAGLLGVGGYVTSLAWRGWRDRDIDRRIDRYASDIQRSAAEFDLPVELVRSVIRAESGGDPSAVSRSNAKGLMQIMAAAEQDAISRLRIAPGDLFDGDYNIRIGCCYLRLLLNRFEGDVYLSLAAYNWGPAQVARVRRDNPTLSGRDLVERFAPKVTAEYCRRIVRGRWDRLTTTR